MYMYTLNVHVTCTCAWSVWLCITTQPSLTVSEAVVFRLFKSLDRSSSVYSPSLQTETYAHLIPLPPTSPPHTLTFIHTHTVAFPLLMHTYLPCRRLLQWLVTFFQFKVLIMHMYNGIRDTQLSTNMAALRSPWSYPHWVVALCLVYCSWSLLSQVLNSNITWL